MKKVFAAAAFVAALSMTGSGCYHNTITMGTTPEAFPTHNEQWRLYFIHGLVNINSDIHLGQTCPNGVARIETRTSFLNVLLFGLSAMVVTPKTTQVWCNTNRAEITVETDKNL